MWGEWALFKTFFCFSKHSYLNSGCTCVTPTSQTVRILVDFIFKSSSESNLASLGGTELCLQHCGSVCQMCWALLVSLSSIFVSLRPELQPVWQRSHSFRLWETFRWPVSCWKRDRTHAHCRLIDPDISQSSIARHIHLLLSRPISQQQIQNVKKSHL